VVGGSNPSGRAKFAKILELHKVVSEPAQRVALNRFEWYFRGCAPVLFPGFFVAEAPSALSLHKPLKHMYRIAPVLPEHLTSNQVVGSSNLSTAWRGSRK
jgi:hypothetical protein